MNTSVHMLASTNHLFFDSHLITRIEIEINLYYKVMMHTQKPEYLMSFEVSVQLWLSLCQRDDLRFVVVRFVLYAAPPDLVSFL